MALTLKMTQSCYEPDNHVAKCQTIAFGKGWTFEPSERAHPKEDRRWMDAVFDTLTRFSLGERF